MARSPCLILVCLFLLCPARHAANGQEPNEIWTTPVQIGGVSITLPAPSLSDSLDVEQQEKAISVVAGKYPLDRFLKDSIVAPFQLNRENIKNAEGERVGHRVDVWFVAYGPLDAIDDQDLFTQMVDASGSEREDSGSGDSGRGDSGQALTAEQLAARGLILQDDGDAKSDLYQFSVGVIDRVLVQGVILATTLSTPNSHTASVRLDERFKSDAEFPNQWRHLDGDTQDWVPYSGLAGYAKATRLKGPLLQEHGDAILVECHAVMHEPGDWFRGPNLLSSKLPLVTQDAVRKFRRNLARQVSQPAK